MTFRDYLIEKRGTVRGSLIEGNKRTPIFTPIPKKAGDLVLGAGYKWRVVS